MKTRQSFGASRLTRFLHNTRSSASFHISHNLSLSIPLDRQIAVVLAFHVIPPLTFPYKIVLAMVHFAFTTSPNHLNLLFRVIVLFLSMRQKSPFFGTGVAILPMNIFTNLTRFSFWQMHFHIPIGIFMISSPPCFSRYTRMPSAPGNFPIFNAHEAVSYTLGWSCNYTLKSYKPNGVLNHDHNPNPNPNSPNLAMANAEPFANKFEIRRSTESVLRLLFCALVYKYLLVDLDIVTLSTSVITIDWMHLTWAACADSKMSNGINMYETSLSDNKLNSAQSLSPWRSVDCAGSVTCIVCHPKVKSWNCTTSPRALSAGRDQGAVHDDGGWTAYLNTSPSSTSPSQRQFVSPSIASTGEPFFVVWPLRWMTSKSFKSSKSSLHHTPL